MDVRAARLVSWSLLIAGLASLGFAGLQGDLEVFILLVVPVVAGTGPWAALGLLATIAGVAGLLWTAARRRASRGAPPGGGELGDRRREARADDRVESERETEGGGVILLGPIPIAWGSDQPTAGWLVVAGIVLTLAAIALTLLLQP